MPDEKKNTPDPAPEENAEEMKTENEAEDLQDKNAEEETGGTQRPTAEEAAKKDPGEEPEEAGEGENPEEAQEGENPEEACTEGEESEASETQEANPEAGKGRRFWQKQSKPPKKDKKDTLIDELNDKVARMLAEFENFRKRTEKEKLQNYTIGARDVLEKILPVLDNFERGLEKADLSDPFAEGMDKVYKQLSTTLEELGVTPIEAVGKEFDPNLHNAVMHIEDETLGENIVAEEFQKGYLYKDQVLRYSMVKVAN